MGWRTALRLVLLAAATLAPATPPPAVAAPDAKSAAWEPIGLSGGGGMFSPAISPADGRRMMLHCDMSGAYVTDDGGRSWSMIHHSQLTSNTRCRPAFHPTERDVVYSPTGNDGQVVSISTDGGVHWKEQGKAPGPLRGEIAIDPDDPSSMLVGAGDTVCRSEDAGKTWTVCRGPHGEAVGFHFDRTSSRERRAEVAATKAGIWRTSDGGRTWIESTTGLPSSEVRSLSGGSPAKGTKGSTLLYCSVPSRIEGERLVGGVYRSSDGGATWQPAGTKGLNLDTKAFDRWAMGPIAQFAWVLTCDANPRRVYAFSSSTGVPPPHHATVFRSDDAGETWRATFQADPRFPACNVEPDYVVAEDGQHYQDVPFGVAIDARDADRLFFVVSDAYVTEDGGATWFPGFTRPAPGSRKPATTGRTPGLAWECNGLVVTSAWNTYEDPFHPKNRFICYTDIGFAKSEDAGRTWRWWSQKGRAPWRNTCYELAFDPDVAGRVWGAFSEVHDIPNGNIVFGNHRATGAGGVCVSTDSCETWTPSSKGLPEAPVRSIALDRRSKKNARVLWAGVFGVGVYRSADGGATWEPRNEGLGSASNRRVVRVSVEADGSVWALVTALRVNGHFEADGVGLYRSKDEGKHWECVTASERFLWPKDFTVDPSNPDVVYLGNCDCNGDGKAGLWRTKDGGRSWKRLAHEGPEHVGAALHPTKKGWIYMTVSEGAPGAGLWLSKDDGAHFEPVDGLPFKNATRVAFLPSDPDAIYVSTFGGSVWRGTGVR